MMPRVYLLKKKNASKFSVFLGFTHDSQILELYLVLSDLFHKYMLQEILLVNFTSFFFFSIP